MVTHTLLVTHPSYWSHTHPAGHTRILLYGHTPILLVTHPSFWSYTHPTVIFVELIQSSLCKVDPRTERVKYL